MTISAHETGIGDPRQIDQRLEGMEPADLAERPMHLPDRPREPEPAGPDHHGLGPDSARHRDALLSLQAGLIARHPRRSPGGLSPAGGCPPPRPSGAPPGIFLDRKCKRPAPTRGAERHFLSRSSASPPVPPSQGAARRLPKGYADIPADTFSVQKYPRRRHESLGPQWPLQLAGDGCAPKRAVAHVPDAVQVGCDRLVSLAGPDLIPFLACLDATPHRRPVARRHARSAPGLRPSRAP
jgi:hypothetical protein